MKLLNACFAPTFPSIFLSLHSCVATIIAQCVFSKSARSIDECVTVLNPRHTWEPQRDSTVSSVCDGIFFPHVPLVSPPHMISSSGSTFVSEIFFPILDSFGTNIYIYFFSIFTRPTADEVPQGHLVGGALIGTMSQLSRPLFPNLFPTALDAEHGGVTQDIAWQSWIVLSRAVFCLRG